MIHTANHNMDDLDRPVTEQGWRDERPIEVGRNCWIGMSALILPGVRIGDGCVLGAGAVLTRDLDDYTVAVGNPARPIRRRR
jgi:acetyltransferase-like isoleucine patch superfamily enzyme